MALDEQTSETSTPASDHAGRGDAGSTRSRNRGASSFSAAGTNLSSHLNGEEQFTPDPSVPIRGGYIKHLDVVYVGGASIAPYTYLLNVPQGGQSCWGAGQFRDRRNMGAHLAAVRSKPDSAGWLTFQGSLESTPNSKQLDKVEFLQRLTGDIKVYGLEALFSPLANDGKPKLLTENIHDFTLQGVVDDHTYRLRKANTCARAYDTFEMSDFTLSHALVSSYLSPKLYSDMQTAYTNVSEFAYLPGQIILMLALENTNNLVTYDIDEARKSFEAITLISYPGENVGDLVKDCLKYLRIMDGGYCLPYNVQSTFLYKVNDTNSKNFNFQVSAMLQKVLEMEDTIGQHKNPKEILRHPHYTKYNVWALCDSVASTYRQEVGFNRWVVERLPSAAEGNLGTDSTGQENPGGKSCWDCGSFLHLCNSPKCPMHGTSNQGTHRYKSSRSGGGGGYNKDKSSSGGDGNTDKKDKDSKQLKSIAPWRLIHPADSNACITVEGREYKFCSKCVYRGTNQTGFYTTGPRMHSTAEHTASSTDSQGSEANLGAAASIPEASTPVPSASTLGRLPSTAPELDPNEPGGMYAGGFTAAALGFHAEVIEPVPSKDEVELQMAAWDDVDDMFDDFDGWDLDGSGFLAMQTHASSHLDASVGAFVRVLNQANLSTGKRSNLYGFIIQTPKPGGLYYKISVYDRGLQCFREFRRCRDKFVVVGLKSELPPLLSAWKSSESSGPLLAVGLGAELSDRVHLEFLFESRECPIATESQYSLLALARQYLVTHPPTISRNEVPAGYLDDETEVSSLPGSVQHDEGSSLEEEDNSLPEQHTDDDSLHEQDTIELTSKVNSLALYDQFFFDAVDSEEDIISVGSEEDTFHDALEELPSENISMSEHFKSFWVEESLPIFSLLHETGSLGMLMFCRLMWFLSAIFWDSLAGLLLGLPSLHSSLSPPSATCKHSRNLRRYPRAWMLLSCIQLTHNAPGSFGVAPPVDLHVLDPLHHTWYRQSYISSSFLDPDPLFLLQYQGVRGAQCMTTLRDAFTDQEENSVPLTLPLGLYIDPVADTSCTLENVDQCFFDAHDSLPFTSCLHLDGDSYFDSDGSIHSPKLLWNFDLSTLHSFYAVDSREYSPLHIAADAPSPLAFSAGLLGSVDLLPPLGDSFPVIFDTGASLAISPCVSDFVPGSIQKLHNRYIGGLANGLPIAGVGIVRWVFPIDGDKDVVLSIRCYHVPNAKARLLSPQRIFSKQRGVMGKYTIEEDFSTLQIDGLPDLQVNYSSESNLPVRTARNFSNDQPQANLGVLNPENKNLTAAQKDFLRWHYRLGHMGMQRLKGLLCCLPFSKIKKFEPLAKCPPCRCEVCQYAKQARTKEKGKTSSVDVKVDGNLKSNILRAGERVSVDHFESRLKGRTFTSFGGANADSYRGGCVFVDHMSGYLHTELQVGFSATETIRAKQNFEQLAGSHGVSIHSYLADNGAFKAHSFERHIRESNQKINFCGVNAHHQNGIAERNIRTVSDKARAMLLHAALHWKDAVSDSLWPMAVQYAAYQHNHLPNAEGHAPADLFTGTTFPRHKLLQMHTWGCPVYVLDPKLQQGKKLPRWDARARRGMFVGFSSVHSSDVPLVLNLQTGHISPQFHVVFDDDFTTVSSLGVTDEVPDFWQQLSLIRLEEISSSVLTRIPLDPASSIEIEDIWLPTDELEEKRRHDTITDRIRQVHFDDSSSSIPPPAPSSVPAPSSMPAHPSSAPSTIPSQPPPAAPTVDPSLRRSSRVPVPRQEFNISTTSGKTYSASANFGCEFSYEYNHIGQPAPITECNLACMDPDSNDNVAISGTITDQYLVDDVLLHQADSTVDLVTGQYNGMDPRAYAAKHRSKIDPDMPSYEMAGRSADKENWEEAMKIELRTLLNQQTWTELDRKSVTSSGTAARARILPGTWAFKLKRRPDGSPLKFKARYCVRGDLQTAGVDYFETYAPVVQWSTVRLLLSHTLINGWTTKQVDYTNAFAQAELSEDVYIERPKGFPRRDGKDTVLKLNKSLYGLKQAPKSFYDKLRAGLEQRGFTRSEIDHCLFMKKDMMVVVYVDDTIICGPDAMEIEKLISDLGVSDDEHREVFELRDEGNVGDFLGIRIEKQGDSYLLTQKGLTGKVIKAAYMEDSNAKPTPVSEEPLGKDANGDPFTEDWKYSEIVGMLLYLANNSRPDIAYAVHQCARFTHDPKQSHAEAVKRILRYLQGTKDKGILLQPDGSKGIDCFVDADFAGLWKSEDAQDPVSVKSRTGYLITFLGCPLSWCSKLQTQIALSTMEAEYIALSTALREVIAVREILKEIQTLVLKDSKAQHKYTFFAKSFGRDRLKPTIVHEDNNACLQFAMMPKMNPRTKHIAIPYHFFRKYIVENEILVKAIGTDDQLADQFTKGLGRIKFERARKKLMGW